MSRHQTKGGKPTGYVYVRGWKHPLPNWANVIGPPAPGAPLYGPKAAEYVRELWRRAKRKPRVAIGTATQYRLLAVVRGDEPLSLWLWQMVGAYIEGRRREQAQAADAEARSRAASEHRAPMRVQLGGLGRGVAVRIGALPTLPAPEEAERIG